MSRTNTVRSFFTGLSLLAAAEPAFSQVSNPIFVTIPLNFLLEESKARSIAKDFPDVQLPDVLDGIPGVPRRPHFRVSPKPRNVISQSLDCDGWDAENNAVTQLAKDIVGLKLRLGLAIQNGNLDEAKTIQDNVSRLSIVRDNKSVIAALTGLKVIDADVDLDPPFVTVNALSTGIQTDRYRMKPVALTYAGTTVTTVDTSSLYPKISNGQAVVSLTSFDVCTKPLWSGLGKAGCFSEAPRFHLTAKRRDICTASDPLHGGIASVVIDYDTRMRITFFIGDSPHVSADEEAAENAALNRILDAQSGPLVRDVVGSANFAVDDSILDQYKVVNKEYLRSALLMLRSKTVTSDPGSALQQVNLRVQDPGLHYRLVNDLIYFDFAMGKPDESIAFRREGAVLTVARVIVDGKVRFED